MNKEVIYKFYDLESLTQEELNGLARERNTLAEENKQLKETINKARNNIITDIAMIKKQYVEKPEIIMRLEQTIKILGDKE